MRSVLSEQETRASKLVICDENTVPALLFVNKLVEISECS